MAESQAPDRGPRLTTVLREGERVKPLELFFDLVFVLAVTQCTAVMVGNPHWEGIGQAMLLLALIWWAWAGYAWLTSVVDPEEGWVRLALFAAMAALLLVALAMPQAFADGALQFAVAYAAVRAAHIALFVIASREDAGLRRSVLGLGLWNALGASLLVAGALLDAPAQAALWATALALDFAAPIVVDPSGWRLAPEHFAERHGLIVLVALGESIVALGVGAEAGLGAGVAVAAVLGVALVAALWWLYFDIVAIANVRRLVRAPEGRERNVVARDAYSYLHLPLVCGIVIAAFGLHEALHNVGEPLHAVPAFGILGGVAIYLLGHVAVRLRGVRSLNRQRLALGIVLLAALPLGTRVTSLLLLGAVTAALCALIAYETRGYGPRRVQVRRAFDRHEY